MARPRETDSPEIQNREVTVAELGVVQNQFSSRKRKRKFSEWHDLFIPPGAPFPEGSDGTDLLLDALPMLAKHLTVDSDGTGAIASTPLLAAFATGKNIIYEMSIVGAPIATPAGPAGCVAMEINDISQWSSFLVPSVGILMLGPQKQDTSNTQVLISAAAGAATASSRFSINVRYKKLPD